MKKLLTLSYHMFANQLISPISLALADGRRVSRAQVFRIVEAINRTIVDVVRDNGFRLNVPSIGVYLPRETKARNVKSPNEIIDPKEDQTYYRVKPQRKVGFRPGKAARQKL